MLPALCRLVLVLLVLGTLCTESAAADARTAQIGGGSEASIRCDGSRLSYQRRDTRSIRLRCRPGTPRNPLVQPIDLESVDLDDGEELRVLCEGARLTMRRIGRSEMRASCTDLT